MRQETARDRGRGTRDGGTHGAMNQTSQNGSYTGRRRERKTSRAVRVADRLSRWIISVGGIGTVLSVTTVFFFLLYVAWPLLLPSKTAPACGAEFAVSESPEFFAVDEYRLMGVQAAPGGVFHVFRLGSGAPVARHEPYSNGVVTAAAFDPVRGTALLGLADGSARLLRCRFEAETVGLEDAPEAVRGLGDEEVCLADGRVWQRVSDRQVRVQAFVLCEEAVLEAAHASAVRRVDFATGPDGLATAMLHEDGAFEVVRTRRRKNILTGKVTLSKTVVPVPYVPRTDGTAPEFLLISGLGDEVTLAWRDGVVRRYDVRRTDNVRLVEEVAVLPGDGRTLTALGALLGRSTLLAGDSTGEIRAWFAVNSGEGEDAATRLVTSRVFVGTGAAVVSLASSARIRMFAAGYADGEVRLFHATSGKRLAGLSMGRRGEPVRAVALAPKDDAVVAADGKGYRAWSLDPRHPEASPRSLFGKVWYEGYAAPAHVWQSSSGTDDFEPKLGLVPLIFGTLKAALFSLLFGVPVALLAAVFTSEFLHPRWKARVKPTVEMMASLPSVVLGFLAALVFAPFVGRLFPAVLAAFVTVPAAFLAGAYGWQLLPQRWALVHRGWRLVLVVLAVPFGCGVAALLGGVVERMCFAGDVMRWLDGQTGGAAGGWAALLFPVSAALCSWGFRAALGTYMRQGARRWSRQACAVAAVVNAVAVAVAAVAVAAAAGHALAAAGADPRGGLVGTYVQRNALVVGFVMGFAIIPIVYTLADDALSAVPAHLRSASLGAGATPWQTAMRIVVPTAASGLFSAVMIGVGRAVGETMIVLMAAGNTPVLEWNLFNGFRTLAANIAVELPEAVRNSTHYRTLFLAALVLFAMTFVVNTLAEIVRQRFRKRAYEL